MQLEKRDRGAILKHNIPADSAPAKKIFEQPEMMLCYIICDDDMRKCGSDTPKFLML